MNASPTQTDGDNLLRDSQGAILILGIVMGAFLVGILFHLASMGHAMIWREFAQDAADSVAYDAALWNARGMNTIVAVNIFLAIVMAILMLWRLLLLFVVALAAVCVVACMLTVFLPFLAPACSVATLVGNVARSMVQMDRRISQGIYRVMVGLHKGQIVIASATPFLSTVTSSVKASTSSQFDVDYALGLSAYGSRALSSSMSLPGRQLKPQPAPPLPCGVTKGNGKISTVRGGEPLLGLPLSLPVQDDEEEIDTLCGKGALMQAKVVFEVFQFIGDKTGMTFLKEIGDPLGSGGGGNWGKIWEFLASMLSGLLCEDVSGVIEEKVERVIDMACEKEKDEDKREKCEADLRKKHEKDNKNKAGPSGPVNSNDVRWTRVWYYTGNGDLFMQSWGIVSPKMADHEKLDEYVGIANSFGGTATETELEEEHVYAAAEMFFDCQGDWQGCRESAPWTMSWRARLRRVHDPIEYAASTAERVIVEKLMNTMFRSSFKDPVKGFMDKVTNKMAFGTKAGSVAGNVVVQFGASEVRDRGKADLYEWGGVKSATQWATDQLEKEGDNVIIH